LFSDCQRAERSSPASLQLIEDCSLMNRSPILILEATVLKMAADLTA
jgi:hypothetical protein